MDAPVALASHQIGIDENGLGPRLGPMVVTAVRIEVDPVRFVDHKAFTRVTRRAGIGDSKAECAHGSMGEVEGRVLAILEHHVGLTPSSFTDLAASLSLETDTVLRSDCPDGDAPTACFADPITLPAFGTGPSKQDRAAATKLLANGVALRAARVGFACVKRINVAQAAGRSRFDLDLALMVRLAASLQHADARDTMLALCGRVGGRKSYAAALESLAPLVGVLGETPLRSSYRVPGFGEVHFVVDGDASEPAIGLASLIGKYVRELAMHRLNRYWIGLVPAATPASGYHDPVTTRLITATALLRRERAFPDHCFER